MAKIYCNGCGEKHNESDFYVSYNPIYSNRNNKMPFCKEFIVKQCTNDDETPNIDKLKEMLRQLDAPFLYDYWEASKEEKANTIKAYFKNLSLKQNRGLRWKDSRYKGVIDGDSKNKEDKTKDKNSISKKDIAKLQEKYGYGFTEEEYLNFERKYKKISKGYKEKTALHTERLITYIIHKVKEEMATARGDVAEAEKWAKLAQKDAQDAKLNVSQLSKSDITGGIDLIPQLVEAVELNSSLIPIMPKLKEQPYDDADLIIWAIINKSRMIEDKPLVEYREIWKFYDSMIKEYYGQRGYSEEEIKSEVSKRETPFRDLSKVYVEPLYESNEFMEDGDDIDAIL